MAAPLRMNSPLKRSGYRVVATRPGLLASVPEVADALEFGATAWRDPLRADFYELATVSGCYYIHVYEAGRKVYVLSPLARNCGQAERTLEYAGCV